MSDKPFRALDADFREGLRSNIKAADLITKLQNHVMNPVAYPMSQTQVKVALGLLGYVLPQLKAVEHIQTPTRQETREELIERIAQLHAGTTAATQPRGAAGTAPANGAGKVLN